jgi:hypothetical protein
MKRVTLIALPLFLLLGGFAVPFLLHLFKAGSDIRAAVIQTSHHFDSDDNASQPSGHDGENDPSGGGPKPQLLGADDAAFLRYAKAARAELSLPAAHKPRYEETGLTNLLIMEAEGRQLAPEGTPAGTGWSLDRSTFEAASRDDAPLPERLDMARLLEGAIHEVSERMALSLSDQAILRHLDAEAELRTIHENLTKLIPGTGKLPADPLMLLPPEQMERAINSLRPHDRALHEHLAIYDTAEVKTAVAHLKARIDRYTAVRESPAYSKFHKDRSGFKKLSWDVTKEQWEAVQADFSSKARAEAARLKAQEASIPGQEHIIRFLHQQRGPPPDAPAARIVDAVRYFDLDVATSIRSQARLEAAISDLRIHLRADHPLLALGGYQLLLTTLNDPDLHQFTRLLTLIQRDEEAHLPDVQERRHYTKQWIDATTSELARRNSGGDSAQRFANDHEIAHIIERHLKDRDVPLTSESRAKYLAVSQLRFPDNRTMPVGVKEEVDRLVINAVANYQQKLRVAREKYETFVDRVAKITGTIEPEVSAKFAEYKNALRQAVREYRDYVWTAEDRQIKLDKSVHEHLAILCVWFFGPDSPPPPLRAAGPPQPDPKGPQTTSGEAVTPSHANELVMAIRDRPAPEIANTAELPPDPHIPGPRPVLLMTDPAIDRALDSAKQLEASLQTKLENLSIAPPHFAVEKNRFSFSRLELKPDISWSASGAWDKDKTRLPDSQARWEGRLKTDESKGNATKTPFDFEREVWNFKSFRPVGGGIHFGATGRYDGQSLSHFVLRYDLKRQELLLIGQQQAGDRTSSPKVFRLANIRPEVLKPLYQFVSDGRNAAVSIGWGMERSTSIFSNSPEQAVLLDPFLIDTPIGQDLILADTIGWNFHTKQIGSQSFYEEFGRTKEKTDRQTEGLLNDVFKYLEPYQRSSVNTWAARELGEFPNNIFGDIARSILEAASIEQARQEFLSLQVQRNINAGLEQSQLSPTTGYSRAALSDGVGRLAAAGMVFKSHPKRPSETIAGYSDRVVQEQIRSVEKKVKDDIRSLKATDISAGTLPSSRIEILKKKWLKQLFEDEVANYDDMIRSELLTLLQSAISSEKGCHRTLLRYWLAANSVGAENTEGSARRSMLVTMLTRGQTALSVLMDEPGSTTIALAGDTIVIRSAMKYNYARTRIAVIGDRVYFGKAPGDDREVDTLESLRDIVNAHYAEIEHDFSPLQRVARYAELAGFLRWANKAKDLGELGGIDFSELADVSARDRQKFPTPDVLTK